MPADPGADAHGAPGAPPPDFALRWVPWNDPLMRQVADLCYETLHAPFGVERSDDWDNADPCSSHLVALTGRRVAGYARLIAEGDWGHVRQVAVAPHMRGRGIGSALVAETLESARRQRLRRVYLNARMGAVGLYERAGFRVVSPEPFPMPRTYLPHVRMELDPL